MCRDDHPIKADGRYGMDVNTGPNCANGLTPAPSYPTTRRTRPSIHAEPDTSPMTPPSCAARPDTPKPEAPSHNTQHLLQVTAQA